MDSRSKDVNLAAKKLRFNAIDYLKREVDLIAKNSEDYDSTQLNKTVQYTREWPKTTCSTQSATKSTADSSSAVTSTINTYTDPTSTLTPDYKRKNDDNLINKFNNLNFSTNYTSGEKNCSVDNESNTDDEDEDQLTSNCAIHNLEGDFCSSNSSDCTSTYFEDDDESGSVEWEDENETGSSTDDDDEASTASSNEGKVWRKSWSMATILGNPTWLNKFKVKKFDNIQQFEQFKHECESVLQEILCRHAYNTIGSFNKFYEDYKKARNDAENFDFDNFYFNYKAKLTPGSLSCVGLSINLIELLKERFGSTIADHCGVVSCEEIVKNPHKYNMHLENVAKEHCLVTLKFSISDQQDKKRIGHLMFDPGYHVQRASVVMLDSLYPHTGWFTVSDQPHVKREYCYNVIGDRYVTWTTKETKKAKVGDRNKKDIVKEISNLVYVKQEFANPIEIAEKRSFIFSFKSFVIRNRKGCLAGLYGNLKNNSVTIFYPESSNSEYTIEPVRKNVKFDVDDINNDAMKRELQVLAKYIVEMNMEINWPESCDENDWTQRVDFAFDYLVNMLNSYKQTVKDRRFVNEFVEIDLWIEEDL